MGEWLENLIRLIAAIFYHFTHIFTFYYSKPYWFVLDWIIPILCYLYLHYKIKFYLQDGIGVSIFRNLVYSFFGATLGMYCLLLVFGMTWHIGSFFVNIFIKFDKYFIPKLVWDFYKNNAFYPFPILIFIFNMLCIKWDLKDFDKEYGIYKKRRKK